MLTIKYSGVGSQRQPEVCTVLLPGECEFSGGGALLQSLDLPVLQNELHDDVRELWWVEAQPPYLDEPRGRRAGRFNRQAIRLMVCHVNFRAGGSFVIARQLREQCRVQGIGLTFEDGFGLVERH